MTNCLLCQSSLRNTTSFDEMMSLAPAQARQLCEECAAKFFRLDSVATCVKCGRRLKAEMSNPCYECERWQQQINFDFQNRALYEYNSVMKDYMKRYKFLGDYRLRFIFAKEVKKAVTRQKRLLVPIPVNAGTMATRGFNQVTGFLKGCSLVEALKTSQTVKDKRQSEKDRADRLRLIQPFELVEPQIQRISGKNVTIIDDVYTTGTTIRHAASLLYQAGAASVIGITLAR